MLSGVGQNICPRQGAGVGDLFHFRSIDPVTEFGHWIDRSGVGKKLTSGRWLGKFGFLVPVKKDTFGFWIFEKCTLTFAESAREFDFWILDF